jgi:mono/diheme cytochrome c family protein
MRQRTLVFSTLIAACACSFSLAAQTPSAGRRAQAAQMKNPVPVDDASLDLGFRIYLGECAACHGENADGDSKMSYSLDPVPPSLVDEETKYGSTDGEMFVVIRDGVKNTSMKPYGDILSESQMWSLVNYLQSLRPATSQH